MEPSIDTYVTSTDADAQTQAMNAILIHVQSKSITLQGLVQHLGKYLTSAKDAPRIRGSKVLAEVLLRLPDYRIAPASVITLATFFSHRLKDYPCAKEVIASIWALCTNHGLEDQCAAPICAALFKHITVQGLGQSSRQHVFDVLRLLGENHSSALLALGSSFVDGFIQAMDGEKDPRCLVLCFNLARFVLDNFSAKDFTPASLQELFEVTSCYFPVTFTAPKDDPHGISGTALKAALRGCLSSQRFASVAPSVIGLFIEKLDESSDPTKVDALVTLLCCIKSFGATALSPLLKDLFGALRDTLEASPDSDVQRETVAALTALSLLVCPDRVGGFVVSSETLEWLDDAQKDFFFPLLGACTTHFRLPGSKLARVYTDVLAKASTVSVRALRLSLPVVMREFTRHYGANLLSSQKQALLEVLCGVLSRAHALLLTAPEGACTPHPMEDIVEQLFTIFIEALQTKQSAQRVAALQCLTCLLCLPEVPLTTEMIQAVVDVASACLFSDEDKNTRSQCLVTLVGLARGGDRLLAPVLASVPLLFAGNDADAGLMKGAFRTTETALDAICALSVCPAVLEVSLPRLVAQLQTQFLPEASGMGQMMLLLNTIHAIVSGYAKQATTGSQEEKAAATHALSLCLTCLPEAILTEVVKTSLAFSAESQELDNETVAGCGRILSLLVQAADSEGQTKVLALALLMLMDGDVSTIGGSASQGTFAPLREGAPRAQQQLVPLFTGVLSVLHRTTPLPRLDALMAQLLRFASSVPEQAENQGLVQAALRGFAALLNKLPKGESLSTWVNRIFCQAPSSTSLVQQALADNLERVQRIRATRALIWSGKALIMRPDCGSLPQVLGHDGVKVTVEKSLGHVLCMLLFTSDTTQARIAADGLGTLLEDFDSLLCKDTHAYIGFLYKQRFFSRTLPLLLQAHKTAAPAPAAPATSPSSSSSSSSSSSNSSSNSSSARDMVLLALASLLRPLPRTVMLQHVQTLLPLLVQAVACSDLPLRLSVLHTITKLALDDISLIVPHISILFPLLLSLSTLKESMKVRVLALRCLEALAAGPYHRLHPLKHDVYSKLIPALNDHKRAVRKQAARTRNRWYVLTGE